MFRQEFSKQIIQACNDWTPVNNELVGKKNVEHQKTLNLLSKTDTQSLELHS
jgi:hypothetical protein